MRRIVRIAGAVLAVAAVSAGDGWAPASAGTLAAVIARGELRCGLAADAMPGFALRRADGAWEGFDVAYCRAIAAATLGDGTATRFEALEHAEQVEALATGRVDVVAGMVWQLERDARAPIDFAAVTFFDGQAFLVRRELGVRSALELDGARICVLGEGRDKARLDRFFADHLMHREILLFRAIDELFAAYEAGLCDAATAERSRLASRRRDLEEPDAHLVLPELVAKRPRALAVAEGDPGWGEVVRWVHEALVSAEEEGLTRARVREQLLAKAGRGDVGSAAALGLPVGWERRAVAAVGHYGEVFARHLGPDTAMGLDRGFNALWRDGGLHFPLPLR
jgi:general L-amino acid transport system substrate-binding protein